MARQKSATIASPVAVLGSSVSEYLEARAEKPALLEREKANYLERLAAIARTRSDAHEAANATFEAETAETAEQILALEAQIAELQEGLTEHTVARDSAVEQASRAAHEAELEEGVRFHVARKAIKRGVRKEAIEIVTDTGLAAKFFAMAKVDGFFGGLGRTLSGASENFRQGARQAVERDVRAAAAQGAKLVVEGNDPTPSQGA